MITLSAPMHRRVCLGMAQSMPEIYSQSVKDITKAYDEYFPHYVFVLEAIVNRHDFTFSLSEKDLGMVFLCDTQDERQFMNEMIIDIAIGTHFWFMFGLEQPEKYRALFARYSIFYQGEDL